MPPANQDGKKPDSPDNPLAGLAVGGDDFDWDKAIDEWDPTFLAENELPPELSEPIAASRIPAPVPEPVRPVVVAAPVAAPAPAKPTGEADAAPLPPPPVSVVDNLQLEIDLARPPSAPNLRPVSAQSGSDALAAQKQRLLEAVVTTSDSTGYAARAASEAAEDEGYEIQIESAAAKAAGNLTPPLAAPPAAAKPAEVDPLADLFVGIDLPATPPLGGSVQSAAAARAAGPAPSPGESASDVAPLPPPPVAPVASPRLGAAEEKPALASAAASPAPAQTVQLVADEPGDGQSLAKGAGATVTSAQTPEVGYEGGLPAGAMSSPAHKPVSLANLAASSPAAAPVAAPVAIPASIPAAPPAAATPALNRGTPIVPRRLPLPTVDKLPAPAAAAVSGSTGIEAATRRHFFTLLDIEAKRQASRDPARAAKLACAAAQQADALHEPADAQERYRQALELLPTARPAMRGLRRELAWPGPAAQPDEAAALLERELELSSAAERAGLLLPRSELLRVQGQLSDARTAYQEILREARVGQKTAAKPGVMAALWGLADVAIAQQEAGDLIPALDSTIDLFATQGTLRTALVIERGRLDELAGRDSAAMARYEAVLADGQAKKSGFAAGLGLLRVSSRLPKVRKDETPLLKAERALLTLPLPTGLRAALLRQSALALGSGAAAGDRLAAFTESAQAGDFLSMEDLAQEQERSGELPAAAATYIRLSESVRDAAQRSLALTSAGEVLQRAGKLAEAKGALTQALAIAAAADLEHDAVTGRLLERVSRALGRPEDLLAMWRQDGQTGTQGAYMRVLAARLLLEQPEGRAGAIVELRAALQSRADYPPAVAMLSDLLVAEGRFGDAAQILFAAASATTEPLSRSEEIVHSGYREEAMQLLWRAGQVEDAARRLLSELGSSAPVGATVPSLQPALRWRLAALAAELVGRADETLSQQVAEILRTEAERGLLPARAAELWVLRGALLERSHPQAAPSSGPVEESLQRALAVEPGHGPALLRLHQRAVAMPGEALAHSPLAHNLVAALRTRFEASQKRPEGMMWALRLAAAQEHESGDASGALLTYRELRRIAPDHPVLLGLEETIGSTAWRAGQAMDIIEHELAHEADYDVRFALLLQAGEYLEAHHQPAQAAKRFAQALEIRPGHPVARSAQVRAYQAAGMLDELGKVTAAELKEATDIQTRVSAYERQALLAKLGGGETAAHREAIIEAYRNILNVDANNHSAMRALERHYIAHEQWGELIHLYEQMGLTAVDTAFAVHIHLDRARLRQRLVWQGQGDASAVANELENDYRLALYRDRHSRPALRYLLAAALRKDDLPQIATLYLSAGELGAVIIEELAPEHSEAQSAAVFFVRAAEAQAAQGRPPTDVIATYRQALKRFPEHLAGLRGMLHFAITHQNFAAVADAAEGLAEHLHDLDERYLHYMLVGVVAQELLKDLPRARRAFAAGLRLLPQREEAFGRLRGSYAGSTSTLEDAKALAELIASRLSQPDFSPANEVVLRTELALLYAGPLADRPRAKEEMGRALALSPNNPGVLYAIGKLYADDQEWQQAVEHLQRYAQVEQRPAQLIAVHLLLGEIFAENLDNLQQSVAQYTRVLQLQPQNQLALTKLSDMFLAQKKGAGALPLLRRLVKYTDDKQKKIAFYHRIAALSDETGDSRGALEALRQAVDVDPANPLAIGELASYYERHNDLQSLRIHLDRAAGRFRPLLRERPRDPALYKSLLDIFLWRRTADLSAMAAGAITALGGAVPAELQVRLDRQPGRKEPTRDGLRDTAIDDVLYPSRLAPGFRALFKLLQEPLGKLYGSDAKKLQALGVDKREKLPRSGHPLRELANRIASELGVGDFDLYVTSAQGRDDEGRAVPLYTIEPTEPPSLVLSSSLVEGSGVTEAERRFFLGGLLKLLQSYLVLPLRLSPDDLGVLVGGLVRQYVPDYAPLGFAEKRIVNEAQRQKRAIPSKLQPQVLPYAMECASATLDFEGIADTLTMASHHAGLLFTGNLPSAVTALRRKGPGAERQIDDLLRFAVSDEFAELQRLASGSK